mgnify:CR=1 FL=1
MPDVHSELVMPAPLERVWEAARAVERFSEFLPNVKQVVVRAREGERTVTEWEGLVPEFRRTIRWVEEDRWDETARRCEFHAISGDWDRYEGVWSFTTEGDRTRVVLDIGYDYRVPLIGPLIQKLLHKLVVRNAEEMLEGLRRQVAGGG